MEEATFISASDPRLSWQGAVSLERTDEWVRPWRIELDHKGLFHNALIERGGHPAGVRIAFASDTRRLAGRIVPCPGTAFTELLVDGEVFGAYKIGDGDCFAFEDLPAGMKRLELWLPQLGEFRLCGLEVSPGATVERIEDDRPKWLVYGSSITQARGAQYPTRTWAGTAAMAMNCNHWNLGYAGECHLDPMVWRMMRDMAADYLTIKVGINIYSGPSRSVRTFAPAIIGMVLTIREKHPDVPFAVCSPIYSEGKEDKPNAVGLTLRQMREEVQAAVEALRTHGDKHLHYVDGPQLLGPDEGHLLADGTHPTVEGYVTIGKRFAEKVGPILAGDKV